MQRNKIEKLANIKRECLRTVLDIHKKANAGHIAASLSCLDILVYLFFEKMGSKDKFILSKGHAASALYSVLARAGTIPEDKIDSFCEEGTSLAAHPPTNKKLSGVTFGTGSLGHGLSLACGIALSAKYSGKKFNVYCVISEGDCNEGSTWEAALFAAQHKLSNLHVIFDNNRIQAFGRMKEVLDLEPIRDKWKAFNFDTAVAENGHDFGSLDKAFNSFKNSSGKPKIVIAKTTKGAGVSFMEDKLEWHYLPMNDDQYAAALKETSDA